MNNKIHQASKQSSQQVLTKQHPNAYKDAAITYFVCGLFAAIGGTILTIWASTEIFGSHIENLLYPTCFAWALSLICMSVALYYKSKKTLPKIEEKRDQHLPNVHDRDHGNAYIKSAASISAISSTTSSAKTMPPVVGITTSVNSEISASNGSDITVVGIVNSDVATQSIKLVESFSQTSTRTSGGNSANTSLSHEEENGKMTSQNTKTNRPASTPIVINRKNVNHVPKIENVLVSSNQEVAKENNSPMGPVISSSHEEDNRNIKTQIETMIFSEVPVTISSISHEVYTTPTTVEDQRQMNHSVSKNQHISITSPPRGTQHQQNANKQKKPMMPSGKAPLYFSEFSSLSTTAPTSESPKNITTSKKIPSKPWRY